MADEAPSGTGGFNVGLIGAGVLAALLVVFIAQNRNDVEVTLFFWDFTGPLWLVLAVTVLVGLAILELVSWVVRRRR